MRYSRKLNRLASLAVLLPGLAFAGPQDVLETPHDPHNEPIGQLSPNEVLTMPAPRAPEPAPPPPPAPDIDIRSPSGIDVQPSTPALDRFGLINKDNGGFDEQVWQYLTQAEAGQMLGQLAAPLPDGLLRQSVARLLMTAAEPPRKAEPGWLSSRTGRLLRLGLVKDASALMHAVPDSLSDPSILSTAIFVNMVNGQQKKACETFAAMPHDKDKPLIEAYQRLAVYCAVVAGRFDQAELTMNLRREQGNPFDSWFPGFIESLHYDTVRMEDFPSEPTGLDLAMLFAAGESKLPENHDFTPYLDATYLPYHWLIGMSEGSDIVTRALFLESAIGAGNGSASDLGTLYAGIAANSAGTPKELVKRAQAYHALATAQSSTQATVALQAALEAFSGHHSLARILFRDPIIALSKLDKSGQKMIEIAPQAFALMLDTGKPDETAPWMRLMDRHRSTSIHTHIMYELARFAKQTDGELSPAAQQLPPFTLPDDATQAELLLLQRFYRLIPLFGYQPPSLTAALLEERLTDESAARGSLDTDTVTRYGGKGSVAGVLLTAASQPAALHALDDYSLVALIEALKATGHKDLARRAALESMLGLLY